MSLYSVISHPLLSTAAAALGEALLKAQTLAAETALGLSGTSFNTDRTIRAKVAVARQVNLQVAAPQNPYLETDTRADRSQAFAVFRELGGASALDPIAVQIVAQLKSEVAAEEARTRAPGDSFATIRSFR